MYQTFKFLLVRAGISLFMTLTFGFLGLYFFHEIALPNTHFNDGALHWLFCGIFIFIGFVGYGIWGKYRFEKCSRGLRDLDPQRNDEIIVKLYEDLINFTRSSYFSPRKAQRLRNQVIRDYADYLHSIGKVNPESLRIYLKAYLLEPATSRFRLPLLSALKKANNLKPSEIELLLLMFRSIKRPDHAIASYLADIFIKKQMFSRKTEAIFLTAVKSHAENTHAIISFVLPRLLEKNRSDEFALKFYLNSLNFHPMQETKLVTNLANAYCEGNWRAVDPSLHEKCGLVFESLPEVDQGRIRESIRETHILEKWKSIKLFETDDFKILRSLLIKFGVMQTKTKFLKEKSFTTFKILKNACRRIIFVVLDGLIVFSSIPPKMKLGSVVALVFFFIFVIGYLISQNTIEMLSEDVVSIKSTEKISPQSISKVDREYTLQVAAVTSEKQADIMVRRLKSKGLKEVYSLKTFRRTGGYWFKIRVGRFNNKSEAQAYADQLIQEKTIKNYFIISFTP